MKIESPVTLVNQSAEYVFEKLAQPENFRQLMPQSLASFSAQTDAFAFALQGFPQIHLQKKTQTSPTLLVYGSAPEKLPFELRIQITPIAENQCQVQYELQATLNPMLALMAKAPITKLLQTLSEKSATL